MMLGHVAGTETYTCFCTAHSLDVKSSELSKRGGRRIGEGGAVGRQPGNGQRDKTITHLHK